MFRELRTPDYFTQVGIVLGALKWPHEQDIAPETLVAELVPVHTPRTMRSGGTGRKQRATEISVSPLG